MTKSCNEIIFYCSGEPEADQVKGKNVYASWPRLTHYDADNPRRWATAYKAGPGGRRDVIEVVGFEVTMKNYFPFSLVHNSVDSRGQSAKIPQALVYNAERDCYLLFDFRTDGLIETLIEGEIANGVIETPMAFRFAGANYYFVPREGKSFAEFEKAFNQAQKPKTKQSTQIEVGVPFVGSFDRIYRYLGAFKCTQDDNYDPEGCNGQAVNYTDKTVHVYHSCEDYGFQWRDNDLSIEVMKSKMNVKSLELPADTKLYDTPESGVVTTECGSKGAYGFSPHIHCTVDINNSTVKYVEQPKPAYTGHCGWFNR